MKTRQRLERTFYGTWRFVGSLCRVENYPDDLTILTKGDIVGSKVVSESRKLCLSLCVCKCRKRKHIQHVIYLQGNIVSLFHVQSLYFFSLYVVPYKQVKYIHLRYWFEHSLIIFVHSLLLFKQYIELIRYFLDLVFLQLFLNRLSCLSISNTHHLF